MTDRRLAEQAPVDAIERAEIGNAIRLLVENGCAVVKAEKWAAAEKLAEAARDALAAWPPSFHSPSWLEQSLAEFEASGGTK